MKIWANKFNKLLFLTPIVALLCLLTGVYLVPYITKSPTPILNLSSIQWQACIPVSNGSCDFKDISVPKDAKQFGENFLGDIIYKVNFSAPEHCLNSQNGCAIFISEIGDAAQFYLNGLLVGRHGEMPPHGRYAKHYPVYVNIPQSMLKPTENELIVKVHSFKIAQSGIRKGPVGIYKDVDADILSTLQTSQFIITPLISSFLIMLVAVIAAIWSFLRKEESTDINSLAFYSAAISFFLFSSTELPREIVPVHWAGLVHHTARLVSDLFYFEMIRICLLPNKKYLKVITYIFLVSILISPLFSVFYMFNNTFELNIFDHTYLIRRWAVPLLVLPHVIAIWGSYVLPKSRMRLLFIFAFAATLIAQINDSLIFHGYITGSYLIKSYPMLITIVMAYFLFQKHFNIKLQETSRLNADAIVGRLAKQVAHDIRSPVTALLSAARLMSAKPEESAALIKMAAERVDRIANDLLKNSKNNAENRMPIFNSEGSKPTSSYCITDIVKEIVTEKQIEYAGRSDIVIQEIVEENKKASLSSQNFDLKRIISNLVNNSVEASHGKNVIHIITRIGLLASQISIVDQGVGIQPELLKNLNDDAAVSPVTTKSNGHGIGLRSAKSDLQKIGGSLSIKSKEGIGTIIDIRFPTNIITG